MCHLWDKHIIIDDVKPGIEPITPYIWDKYIQGSKQGLSTFQFSYTQCLISTLNTYIFR